MKQVQEVKLSDVLDNIKQGVQYLDKEIKSGVNYTILIGPTGAGKSTLTNVLTGHEIKTDKVNEKKVFVVDGESPIKIGHTNQSETMRPNIEGAYIDCPGFGDTDPTKELQNAIYIKRVFESNNKDKGKILIVTDSSSNAIYLKRVFESNNKEKILIVTEYSSIFSGRAKLFIKLLKDIDDSMGNNFLKFSKQIGLCVSKVPSDEYDQEVTDNPSKISEIIQGQLNESTYKEGVDLIKSLGDRMFFFMKNDSHSLETKLKTLMTKIDFGDKIPVSPILSLEGESAIDSMIEEVFSGKIELAKQAVNKYIYKTKDDFKISEDTTLSSIMTKLKGHNADTYSSLLNKVVSEIKNTNGMDKLIDELFGLTDKVKGILTLSTDGLESVKIIAKIYPKSDELSQNYKLKIADIFSPVIKFEEKICDLLKNVNIMERDWNNLKALTTPSNITKGLIITGGVIGSVALGIATGGAFLAYEGIVAGSLLVGGASAAIGFTALWKKAVGNCDAYEASHPAVLKDANELKHYYKGMPDKFAKLWAASHNHDHENSKYLTDLHTVLIGTHNDDYNSEYNDVFGN